EDAQIASKVLGLALTSRSKGAGAVPMAGVPYHAVDSYVAKMIRAGYRVGICEQMEDASQVKGIVRREVVRLITPGTLTEDSLLEDKEDNFLAAIHLDGGRAGLAWVDLSTGKFCAEDIGRDELLDELTRLGVRECLLPETEAESNTELVQRVKELGATVTRRAGYIFDRDEADRRLNEHFGTVGLDGFGIGSLTGGISAAGAVLEYLQETQKTSLGHLTRIEPVHRGRWLHLDEATHRGLELVRTMRGAGNENTLLRVLDRTATPMGGRMLRQWITFPLAECRGIQERLDAVEELAGDHAFRKDLRGRLKDVSDIERIMGRIAVGRATPRDLVGLATSLGQVPAIKELLAPATETSELLARVEGNLDEMADVREAIDEAIADNAPPTLREPGFIKAGYNEELDRLRRIMTSGAEWLAEFQAREAKATGIANLRVGYNKVFGYYIEVSHAQAGRVPDHFVRKQTLKNAERYIVPELKQHEVEVLSAEEKIRALELSLFQDLRRRVAAEVARVQQVASALAAIDCIGSLAEVATARGYVKPEVADDRALEIVDGRHPVLDVVLGSTFVPNDTLLSPDECRLMIITGPNMSGKSTYIRQVALIVLMAQMGSFIPARRGHIGIVDRIFTRIGASDELARGQSTFMVEMTETANMLNNATDRSLVILDEIGRGTSTFDGLALAWSVAEHIATRIKCRTLFATHYHELTERARTLDGASNFNVAVREWQDEVVFLHKIVEGGTDKSYGIYVARLAGVPKEVIERAKDVLAYLEGARLDSGGPPEMLGADSEGGSQEAQLGLFTGTSHAVLEELRALDIEHLTPLEALMKLKELKDKA
ncbi:MAG: DNA mismatch repair protein MutS, partial [Phycisphaerae bacterium]|nr:DNA mismatch repair protein MutS [Phycisphaerae bacterium]